MNQRCIVALATVLLVSAAPTLAQGEEASRVLTVPGLATMLVSPDSLEIRFERETEHDSFAEAHEAAESMNARLGQLSVPESDTAVSVDYDLTFLKQGGFWGRGKKLTHRFVMTVSGIPDGQAKRVLVELIDQALRLDPKLIVVSFEPQLSEARLATVRETLLTNAVRAATHNAEILAKAAELRIVETHGIGFHADTSTTRRLFENIMVFGRAARFTVDDDLTSTLETSVRLEVSFDVEPLKQPSN